MALPRRSYNSNSRLNASDYSVTPINGGVSAKDYRASRTDKRMEKSEMETIIGIIKDSGQYSPEQLEQIKSKLQDSPDEVYKIFEDAKAVLDSTPEGQARLRDRMSERKAERLSRKFQPFFQAAQGISDITQSLGQVNQARRAAANLKAPGMPSVPGLDPALSDSIAGAQRGTFDDARIAAPARQELQDTYNKELALAKSIGGGQASTLGALGQVAAMGKIVGLPA
jgi:hypothetical protein